jgi:hypothetical protein
MESKMDPKCPAQIYKKNTSRVHHITQTLIGKQENDKSTDIDKRVATGKQKICF